jgi:hypothetical protein
LYVYINMGENANAKVKNYIHSLNSLNNNNTRYTSKDIYDMIKTKLSFNYLPSGAKYSTINKKVVSNSYHDLQIMNQLSYELCTRNIDIYINWLESFHIIENLEKILGKKHLKNISDINQLEQILLSGKCTTSNTQLSSIASENGINNDQNVHRSIILLTNLLKASVSESSKKGIKNATNPTNKGATDTVDEPTKEYCIITTEFCKNIKQAWLMLPKNDINLKNYSSNMKRIVNINKYKTPRKSTSANGNSNTVKNTLKQLVDNLFNIS